MASYHSHPNFPTLKSPFHHEVPLASEGLRLSNADLGRQRIHAAGACNQDMKRGQLYSSKIAEKKIQTVDRPIQSKKVDNSGLQFYNKE